MPNGHLSLVLLLLPMAAAQQQFNGLVGSFPQAQFQPFGSFGLPPMQHPFGVGQAPQFGIQPVQPVQGFQNPFPSAVQPQFNPLFPLTLPSFTLPPHPQPFNPFGVPATVAPIYNTNQIPQQNLQPQQNVQPQQNFQPQQPIQPQQGQQFQQLQPQPQPQPLPEVQPQVEAPTTLVAVQEVPTLPPTQPTPEPTTTEATTALPVVDARSEPKKKKTTTKVVKVTDEVPPEIPTELKSMHSNDEEEQIDETAETVAEETTEASSTESHRSRIQASGSASPRVLDFRSINVGKTTTPTPLSVLRASAKAKEEEQREVDEILNRVLDAVAPMHRPVESGESAGISGESTDF